jgi:hypothetical protein
MILAGFIIAIGLVITTIMFSSVIFAENMAIGEGRDPSRNDIMNLISITKDETREAYNNSTAFGGSNASKFNNFTKQMQNFKGNLSKIYALRGEIVNVTWENWTNKGYANFSDNGTANGISNWTVIENVNKSNITVTVTSGTLYINLTNRTPDWQKVVTSANSTVYINTSNVSYKIIFLNGANASGKFTINGTASGKMFIRARDYIINTSITFSSNRVKVDFRIPVSVPW